MRNNTENSGLSMMGLLVVIFVIIFLMLIVFLISPPLLRVAPISERVICATNLKGLGTAIEIYSQNYDGRFPQLPGEGPWSKELGFDYDLVQPDYFEQYKHTGRTVSASWYLLVREADVSPKSFVCPLSTEKEFDGTNSNNLDIVELRDFGDNPYNHVSYVMQNPYGKYPANDNMSAAFAVAADMNPWMKSGDFVTTPDEYNYPQIITVDDENTYEYGNSPNHPQGNLNGWVWKRYFKGTREGQNVLFADGHVEYTEQPNCGVNNDNIYTYWSNDENPTEQDIQGGTQPTARDEENDSKSEEDSFLVL